MDLKRLGEDFSIVTETPQDLTLIREVAARSIVARAVELDEPFGMDKKILEVALTPGQGLTMTKSQVTRFVEGMRSFAAPITRLELARGAASQVTRVPAAEMIALSTYAAEQLTKIEPKLEAVSGGAEAYTLPDDIDFQGFMDLTGDDPPRED